MFTAHQELTLHHQHHHQDDQQGASINHDNDDDLLNDGENPLSPTKTTSTITYYNPQHYHPPQKQPQPQYQRRSSESVLKKNQSSSSLWQDIKKVLSKIYSWTLGNVRLRMYIYSMLKIFSITYVQANSIILGRKEDLSHYDITLRQSLQIISYTYMGLLLLMFTERYIRELYCVYKRKELLIWVNWIEAFTFSTYVLYSLFTAANHVYYLVGELKLEESLGGEHNEEKSGSSSIEQKFAVELLEIFIHLYIIFDKGSHFLHSGHSISLYLSKAAHIPKSNGHSHGHEHLSSDLRGESFVNDEPENVVMNFKENEESLQEELLDTTINPADRIIE